MDLNNLNIPILWRDRRDDTGKPYKLEHKEQAIQDFMMLDHPCAYYNLRMGDQDKLLSWCKQFIPTERFNHRKTSYGIKHLFAKTEGGFYTTNGAMKGALLLAGFTPYDSSSLNWCFNISYKELNEVRGL